jgi:hypothetical protein
MARMPQHVWVDVTGAFGGTHTHPGVLLEWRRHATIPDKWEALVAYAESDAHGWTMVTRWLLAEHVRKAK